MINRAYGIFRVSEAANLAVHAAAALARGGERYVSAREIAETLKVSEAHLSKVLRALERAGVVRARRGPTGGFRLCRTANSTSLLDVYEAVEGPTTNGRCPLAIPVCTGAGCSLGGYFRSVNLQVLDRMRRTRLSSLNFLMGGIIGGKEKDNRHSRR